MPMLCQVRVIAYLVSDLAVEGKVIAVGVTAHVVLDQNYSRSFECPLFVRSKLLVFDAVWVLIL